jgi:hypothetical protein
VTQHALIVRIGSDPASWERHWVERDQLAIGDEVEIPSVPGRWRIVSEHIPGDSDQPEANAFDVEPIEGSLAPPIRGSMSAPSREAAQNRRTR